MNKKDTLVLKAVCESFANKYAVPHLSVPCRLDTPERNLLAQKILQLPEIDRSLVFFKYYFGFTPAVTGKTLGVPDAKARLDCCDELLSIALGLGHRRIDDDSMRAAARRAMSRYIADNGGDENIPAPAYSAAFRKKFREISAIPHQNKAALLFAKRIAIAAIIAAMSVTTALAASPRLREVVFSWIVNTFPKYSQIGAASVSQEPTEADFELLKQYYPAYIPEGYELYQVFEDSSPTMYDYRDKLGNVLYFSGYLVDDSLPYYNSENAVIETLTYLGQPAFCWEQDGVAYFVWQQDGFQFDIIGKISKNEALKMVESTKLEK